MAYSFCLESIEKHSLVNWLILNIKIWFVKCTTVKQLLPFRDACKKKIAHILSFKDNVQIATPPHPPFVFKTSKMIDFLVSLFPKLKKKNRSFLGFWRKFWFGRRHPTPCLENTKWAFFFFCKHPLIWNDKYRNA